MPYLGIAADYIQSAIDTAGGRCLVNCQMGVSRSASCAMAYLMIHKGKTAVEALTLVRKSRDCRPNDGTYEFIEPLQKFDDFFFQFGVICRISYTTHSAGQRVETRKRVRPTSENTAVNLERSTSIAAILA